MKPMRDNPWTPSLAEAWTASKDELTYKFKLEDLRLEVR